MQKIRIGGTLVEVERGSPYIKTTIANSGVTQARRATVALGFHLLPRVPPDWEPSEADLVENQPLLHLNLIPGKEEYSVLSTISKEVIQALRDDTNGYLVLGTVRYCDIFHTAHFTHFCQRYNAYQPKDPKTGEEFFNFGLCARYNCDDDDCRDYKQDSGRCR